MQLRNLNVGSESSGNEMEVSEHVNKKHRKDTSRASNKTAKISSTNQDDIPYTFTGTVCSCMFLYVPVRYSKASARSPWGCCDRNIVLG